MLWARVHMYAKARGVNIASKGILSELKYSPLHPAPPNSSVWRRSGLQDSCLVNGSAVEAEDDEGTGAKAEGNAQDVYEEEKKTTETHRRERERERESQRD